MVNLIWLLLLLLGIAFAGASGNIEVVTSAALNAGRNAVGLAIELIGVMALWLGMMRIAEKAGVINLIAAAVRPAMRFLFPSVPREDPALGAMVSNISANLLGLGNAATPLGLKAMKELQRLNGNRSEASDAMCTFLALNTSAITLVPAMIIGVRTAAGSSDPAAVVGTTIFATCCATCAAITMDRFFRRRWRGR